MAQRDSAFSKAYSIYPAQDYVIKTIAEERFDGNESFALRHIINEYSRRHEIIAPTPANGKSKESAPSL